MKAFASFLKILGLSLILFGIALFIQRNSPYRISFNNYAPPLEKMCVNRPFTPTIIRIPSLKKVLPIIPATVQNNTWDTTDRGVSHLVTSRIPGEVGNSILYGHNWESLLGGLQNIKTGTDIEIEFNDGTKRVFTVQTSAHVSPNQTDILKQSHDKRITLYTCSGWFDSQRFVVVATLKGYSVALR